LTSIPAALERCPRQRGADTLGRGSFTLEAAEAIAGPGAGPVVLHLLDCSLLVAPRAGPDGRTRYVMLETLRACGAGLPAEAGEQDGAAAGQRAGLVVVPAGPAGR
jgi:hypothetical protein